MPLNDQQEPLMRGECVRCHRLQQVICCGDNTNGFWCLDCCPHPYKLDDGYPYDEEDNFDDDDPFEAFDCAMDRHGNCGKAGSEECDWECPYRNVKRN